MFKNFKDFANSPDMYVAATLVAVLAVMIVPVPPAMMDLLIAISIAASVIIWQLIECIAAAAFNFLV